VAPRQRPHLTTSLRSLDPGEDPVPPRMQNVVVGQATESIMANRRGIVSVLHVSPPFVVRAMPPLYPTTRHTLTDAHVTPITPPTFGRVSLDQCAPSSVVKSASACSEGRGAFASTFGHPGGVISPATTHVLGVGHAMAMGCTLLGVTINRCQWSPPSELPMIEPGPVDSYSPTA
jgi:hypothetical protein